jgi:hypothetical protein
LNCSILNEDEYKEFSPSIKKILLHGTLENIYGTEEKQKLPKMSQFL